MAYATINPYTGEKIVEFPFSTDDEVKNALETGGKAFSSWRKTAFVDRGRILQKAADLFRRDSD